MFAAEVEAAQARYPGSPREQLEETAWAYVRFALAYPDHLRVMFSGSIEDPQAYPGLRAAGARAFAVLLIGRQVPGDVSAALNAEQLARLCSRQFYTGLAPRG